MNVVTHLAAVSTVAVSLLLFDAAPAAACDCHDGGPVCEAFWETPVIFAGRVESVAVEGVGGSSGIRARFRVSEQFRGAPAREIEVSTSNSSCGLSFTAGDEWLIYAFPSHDGLGLVTHTCSRSRLLRHARPDLEYARTVYSRPSAEKGRVFGRLITVKGATIVPVPGVPISLSHADSYWTRASAVTDGDGRYDMAAYPGRYVLKATLPPGVKLAYQPIVNLRDGRGCVEDELGLDYVGGVTGRVVDHSGVPVSHLTIELIAVDRFDEASSRRRAITDASGHFTFTDVVLSRYKAAIVAGSGAPDGPRYVALGQPTNPSHEPQFQIEGLKTLALGTLPLPKDMQVGQMNGVVVNTDGRPEPDTTIRMKVDVDGPAYPWTTISTDKQGRFTFSLVTGIKYRIVADRWDGVAPRRSASVTVDPSTARTVRIVLP